MARCAKYTVPSDDEVLSYDSVPVDVTAHYLGKSTKSITDSLQDGTFPCGYGAHTLSGYTYQISPGLLVAYKRGSLPVLPVTEIKREIMIDIEDMLDKKLKPLVALINQLSMV